MFCRKSSPSVPEPIYYAWVDWLFDGNASQFLDVCRYGPAEPDPDLCAENRYLSALDYVETETHLGVTAGVRAIEAAYAAYNSGDGEGWWIARDAGSFYASPADRLAAAGVFAESYTAERAAGTHMDVHRCHFDDTGSRAWTNMVDDGVDTPTGFRFTCEVTRSNRFHSGGGVDLAVTDEWVTAGGEVVAAKSVEENLLFAYGEWSDFSSDFSAWMAETHPDIPFEMVSGEWYGFPSAASVPAALEYLASFLADSPDWPRQAR